MVKRHGNLWPQITDFENLLLAARNAQRGKRMQASVLRFNYHRETELLALQRELTSKTYKPGGYTTFEIYDPKLRMISAAPYRDRVVHHALCNIIQPIFERTFIDDSYANRSGYGTHRALGRFIDFMRTTPYVLQCDIQKYFPSIDLEILKGLIRRKIKCSDTLWLIDCIIDNSNEQMPVHELFPGDDLLTVLQRRRGLPIGNLTSQFFANVYLNGFDHFVKEQLKVKKYLRYVDDFALFSSDCSFLTDARLAVEDYLAELRLRIHPVKSQLFETRYGANFLGFRVLPVGDTFPKDVRIRVRRENLRRGRRRLKQLQADYASGKINFKELDQSIQSWLAHLDHGDTWQLRKQLFADLVFSRR
ncbi:reverse transcriptase domain-containing protein [Nodosilinea sp. P-1105]|uniref:reverse transcriptase domain-containing protein n=1 Tax=Nodosilinea sp. P-1105 TaxID=2546229 RepID=UPI00146A1439|nr:reverse transcriptase domain-containing protein [Nodosilinea sp. P-1105]NMF84640.1 RNA-dependent DNA polymerase [Nodosilinea sp. P-1105]